MVDDNGAIASTASLSNVQEAVSLCSLTSSDIGSLVNRPQIVPEHSEDAGVVEEDSDDVVERGPDVVVNVDEAEDAVDVEDAVDAVVEVCVVDVAVVVC